jgi:hypothetical protein
MGWAFFVVVLIVGLYCRVRNSGLSRPWGEKNLVSRIFFVVFFSYRDTVTHSTADTYASEEKWRGARSFRVCHRKSDSSAAEAVSEDAYEWALLENWLCSRCSQVKAKTSSWAHGTVWHVYKQCRTWPDEECERFIMNALVQSSSLVLFEPFLWKVMEPKMLCFQNSSLCWFFFVCYSG